MTILAPTNRLLELQLRSVEVLFDGLGESPVTLELSGCRTLLFGRNGVGKSLLLEQIEQGAHLALGRTRMVREPASFTFSFDGLGIGKVLRYSVQSSWAGHDDSGRPERMIDETAEVLEDGTLRPLWGVTDERASGLGDADVLLPRGMGLLSLNYQDAWDLPEHGALARFFRRVGRLPAGVPRAGRRDYAFVQKTEGRIVRSRSHGRIDRIARTLVAWSESGSDLLGEIIAVGRRLKLLQAITVERVPLSGETDSELLWARVDGNDLGYASDGTLRTLELLIALIRSAPGSTLLIEEPETAIHPRLLEGILKEIDAYTADKQAIVSTHSPQVVEWGRAAELRLVTRIGPATSIAPLSDDEIEYSSRYLCEDGSLGDFVYGGGIDEGGIGEGGIGDDGFDDDGIDDDGIDDDG